MVTERQVMKLISQLKKWFWYGLYVVAVAGILLVLRFPSDDLKSYLESAASRQNPATSLSISSLKPSYPLGLWFERIELDQKMKKGKQALLAVENFSVKAEPLPFLKGEYTFHLQGDVYDGNVAGVVRMHEKDTAALTAELSLKGIQTEQYDLIPALTNISVNSSLSGEISYDGKATSLLDGTGEATFELGQGSLSPVKPLFGFNGTVGIEELTLEVSLEKRRLLVRIAFTGPEFMGELSGTIKLRKQVSQSALTLEGSLEALDQLFSKDSQASGGGMELLKKRLQGGAVSFMVTGTVADPKVRLY
jgi:type II secretion system protein N